MRPTRLHLRCTDAELDAWRHAAERDGRMVRVVTPTKKAAHAAAVELGVPTASVAAQAAWTIAAAGSC